MTSFAFILGVLPLVISSGPGSEMRQAVGVAVFFGMIGVTLATRPRSTFGLLEIDGQSQSYKISCPEHKKMGR